MEIGGVGVGGVFVWEVRCFNIGFCGEREGRIYGVGVDYG